MFKFLVLFIVLCPLQSFSMMCVDLFGIKSNFVLQRQSISSELADRIWENADVNGSEVKIKVAFLDADLTIRHTKSGNPWPINSSDVVILPGASSFTARLQEQGYLVVIVSNQGAKMSLSEKEGAFRTTLELLLAENSRAKVDYYDFAEKFDNMRKPNVGMAEALLDKVKSAFGYRLRGRSVIIDKEKSFVIGDAQHKRSDVDKFGVQGQDFSNSDRKFAENLGLRSFHPKYIFEKNERTKVVNSRSNFSSLADLAATQNNLYIFTESMSHQAIQSKIKTSTPNDNGIYAISSEGHRAYSSPARLVKDTSELTKLLVPGQSFVVNLLKINGEWNMFMGFDFISRLSLYTENGLSHMEAKLVELSQKPFKSYELIPSSLFNGSSFVRGFVTVNSSRNHDALAKVIKNSFPDQAVEELRMTRGSIMLMEDGSIRVSGYGGQKKNFADALSIVEFLRAYIPDIRLEPIAGTLWNK